MGGCLGLSKHEIELSLLSTCVMGGRVESRINVNTSKGILRNYSISAYVRNRYTQQPLTSNSIKAINLNIFQKKLAQLSV